MTGYVLQTSRGAYLGNAAIIGSQIDDGPCLTQDINDARMFDSVSQLVSFVHALVNERPARDGLTRNPLYVRKIDRQVVRQVPQYTTEIIATL